jgi:acid phosphatase
MNGIPRSAHVVLVIEENHMFTEVYPNGMPWLVAQGNKYGYATNYQADSAGSAMDYLWLSSGSCHAQDCAPLPAGTNDFHCSGDGCFDPTTGNQIPITDDNIFRELDRVGLTWKVYAQSLPSPGYIGYESGAYVARHNPAVWYSDVLDNASLQRNIVPLSQLSADLAANQLPNYSIIIPDLDNDAHDGTLAQADDFLANNVAPVLNAPAFQPGGDGMMIVTFDECDAAEGLCSEQVYTAVIGPKVIPGTVSSSPYRHESALRTMMDAFGIGVYPGAAATTSDMTDFFPH